MNRSIAGRLATAGLGGAIEISGDYWAKLSWRSYESTSFPTFDLCDPAFERLGDRTRLE
jgi:hypothetical protein